MIHVEKLPGLYCHLRIFFFVKEFPSSSLYFYSVTIFSWQWVSVDKALILEVLIPLHNNLIGREVFFSRMSYDDNAENVQHHIVCFPTRVTESLRWRENEFIIEESIGHVIILGGFAIVEEEGLSLMNECGEQMNERYGLPLGSMNITAVLNYLKDYN